MVPRITDFLVCHRGSEPIAEEAVRFIRETGGVAVLAHPWALKNPAAIVRRLADAGLHGIEAYRSDGKLSGRCSSVAKLGSILILTHRFTSANSATNNALFVLST